MELLIGAASIASVLAFAHWNATERRRAAAAIEATRRLETARSEERHLVLAGLTHELRDISRLIAVTGSITNLLGSGKCLNLKSSLTAHLPPPSYLLSGSIGSLGRTDAVPIAALQPLISMYSLLNFARSATLAFAKKPKASGDGIELEALVEAWQVAAAQSVFTLNLLSSCHPTAETNSKDAAVAVHLVEMLRCVTLGRSPCVRTDGTVIVPGWVERRVRLAKHVEAPARLSANGEELGNFKYDLSYNGIGLKGQVRMMPGDDVSITLASGVKMQGVAVWNSDGRIGVKLESRLPDPASGH